MITRLRVSRLSNRTIWAHPFRWQSFIKIVGAAGISLLLCGLGGCRQSPRQPVTVTIIDPEWSQPDVSPEAKQESQQFTRETGIRVEHPPIPETSLSQLELSRKLLREGGPTPDVFAIDVIWPGMLGDYLIDLKP